MGEDNSGEEDKSTVREHVRVFCRQRPPAPESDDLHGTKIGDDDEYEDDFEDNEKRPETDAEGPTFVTFADGVGANVDFDSVQEDKEDTRKCHYQRDERADARTYTMHRFFDRTCGQEDVYDSAASDIVADVLRGYNGTIMVYGMTSTGKTYTMRGEGNGPTRGITPRALEHIFSAVSRASEHHRYVVTVSYLQIYCEIVMDLLNPQNMRLSIRENQDGTVFVENLSQVPVRNAAEALAAMEAGDVFRSTAATNLNAHSSRSHAALIVNLEKHTVAEPRPAGKAKATRGLTAREDVAVTKSHLLLLDLAGSERAKLSGSSAQYQRMEELKSINLSLSALGNCVAALAEGQQRHVPFRDSKLTRLLQGSLGGNSKTAMIVTVPSGVDDVGESHNTLNFAQRALKVPVVAHISRDVDFEALYMELRRVLDEKENSLQTMAIEHNKAQNRIAALEQKVAELTASREEALKEAESAGVIQRTFEGTLAALQNMHGNTGCSSGGSDGKEGRDDGDGGAGGADTDSGLGALPEDMGQRAVRAIEEVHGKWREELRLLRGTHDGEIETLRKRYDGQVQAYKKAAAQAQQEATEHEYELSKEREAHLATVQEYKRVHDRFTALETESAQRIGDLLTELNEKRERLEEAERQTELLTGTVEQVSGRVVALEEAKAAREADMVSREQVEEMEQLFAESMQALSTRVQQLEAAREQELEDRELLGVGPASTSETAAGLAQAALSLAGSARPPPARPTGRGSRGGGGGGPGPGAGIGIGISGVGGGGQYGSTSRASGGGRGRVAAGASSSTTRRGVRF